MSNNSSSAADDQDWKYPLPSAPKKEGRLKVGDQHEVYWHEYGNRNGAPVMFLHGGPGGGTEPKNARFFNPRRYRIILFDQRGCGKSQPNAGRNPLAALQDNTTCHLIEDIQALRKELNIEDPMHVFGGSWGSTLAMAYAIKHPDNVKTLILRGIFLCRRQDLNYFYQGNAESYDKSPHDSRLPGTYLFYPEAWKKFVEVIDAINRHDMVKAYAEIFVDQNAYPIVEPDTELKEDREKKALKENPQREQALERLERAATAWSVWEGITSFLAPGDNWKDFEEPQFAKEFARIENHYFMHGGFLDGSGKRDNNYLLDSVYKIAHLPVYIVQGQFDQICPRCEADELVAALGVKAKVEYVLTAAGHSATERENVKALTEIMDNL